MIISITGHRPNKLGGYKDCSTHAAVKTLISMVFDRLQPTKVISGMALGVDQWAAEIAVSLKIPFVAAVPFKGQESQWPEDSQAHYRELLTQAAEISYISEPGYSPLKMFKRNEWMVDHSDAVLAVWDGTPGGTAGCVKYAQTKNKKIIEINPKGL